MAFAPIHLLLIFLFTIGTAQAEAARAAAAPYLDSNGWTVFTPSSDTRVVYVANGTGNDTHDGLSERRPVKTIAKGLSLLRSGHPDWILLKKGDSWTNEAFGYVRVSGRSAAEPMLISSYGSGPRPKVRTNAAVTETAIGSLGGPGRGGDYLALVGIEFQAYTRDPQSPAFAGPGKQQTGTRFLNPSNWLLIEDCKFSFYVSNIDFDLGPAQHVVIRRNILVDSYSTSSHSQGLYVAGIRNLVIEENLFDHNGWNEVVANATPTVFNHNIYIQSYPEGFTGQILVKSNIVANASSHGAQVRPGGTVVDNLFVRNPMGILIGNGEGDVNRNVILSGNNISTTLRRGFGIDVNPGTGRIRVKENIIAHLADRGGHAHGIFLTPGTEGVVATDNTVYRWDNPLLDRGTGNISRPNAIDLSGYTDPNRTLETYHGSLGQSPTLAGFLNEARMQSKDNWRLNYTAGAVNDYIRKGFQ